MKNAPEVIGGIWFEVGYGKLKVVTRNTAICARVIGVAGQNFPLPHPFVILSRQLLNSVRSPIIGGHIRKDTGRGGRDVGVAMLSAQQEDRHLVTGQQRIF
jgi:hypothetical protein